MSREMGGDAAAVLATMMVLAGTAASHARPAPAPKPRGSAKTRERRRLRKRKERRG